MPELLRYQSRLVNYVAIAGNNTYARDVSINKVTRDLTHAEVSLLYASGLAISIYSLAKRRGEIVGSELPIKYARVYVHRVSENFRHSRSVKKDWVSANESLVTLQNSQYLLNIN